jgi:parallel beta-helix repeat protein
MDKRKQSLAIVLIVLVSTLFSGLITLPVNVKGATLFVGGTGPGNYTSIQEAVNDSIIGDTVYVFSGTYEELVSIDKNISLVGEDKNTTIISAPTGGDIVKITAHGVSVQGFTLTGAIWGGAAVGIHSAGGCYVADNIMIDNDDGIRMRYSNQNEIIDNIITDTDGIHLEDSNANNISNNIIHRNYVSIWLYESHRNVITGNSISEGYYAGIQLDRSNKTIITYNIVDSIKYDAGIRIRYSSDTVLKGNALYHDGVYLDGVVHENWHSQTIDTSNKVNGRPIIYWKNVSGGVVPPGSGQVILYNCTDILIEDQNLSGASIGVHSILSSGNTIVNNDISLNDKAGIMLHWSDYSVVHNNSALPSRSLMASGGKAMDIQHSNGIVVTNNTVSVGGIDIASSNGSYVANNTVKNGYGNGLQVFGYGNIIANNTVSEYSKGIYVGYGYNLVENNTAHANYDHGISLWKSGNTTLRFNNASANGLSGIYILQSTHITVANNVASRDNLHGIYLFKSSHNLVTDNSASWNLVTGIHVSGSNNTLTRNEMIEDGIYLGGWPEDWISQEIDTSNTVNGKPVYYWEDIDGGTVPSGAGQVILSNCTNVIVKDQNVSHGSVGILVGRSRDITLSNNTAMYNRMPGIYILHSSRNLVERNIASFNNDHGIYIQLSENNTVDRNSAMSNEKAGLSFKDAPNSTITDNFVADNFDGIVSGGCESSVIDGNTATQNKNMGIYESSIHIQVRNNNASANDVGLEVHSYYPTVTNNTLIRNRLYGIRLRYAKYADISDNSMIGNGLYIVGTTPYYWTIHSIDTSNTVNGKPLYFWKNVTSGTIPLDAGQVILANCTGITVDGLNVSDSSVGILLGFSSNNVVTNNIASYNSDSGIILYGSDDNALSGNTASHNTHGIVLYSRNANLTNNTMVENGIYFGRYPDFIGTHSIDTSNTVNGRPVRVWKDIRGGTMPSDAGQIALVNCSDVVVRNQNLSNGSNGIQVIRSSNITVYNNTVSWNSGEGITFIYTNMSSVFSNKLEHNAMGLLLTLTETIDVYNNTVSENDVGIFVDYLWITWPMKIYHNNFIENTDQATVMGDPRLPSSWDDGYPSGGNFWSDYSGVDNCSGPDQDICPDPDGIGDTPYEVPWYELDNYPLMKPFSMDPSRPYSPQNLQAAPGNQQVVLTWSAPYDGGSPITNYRIYRGSTPGGEVFLTEIGNVLTYTDTGLVNGQTYYYMVSAVNAIGEGPKSNEASASPANLPTPPLNLTATAGDQQVSLAWEPPGSNGGSSITNYRIYRGMTSGGEIFLIEVGNVTGYVDTGLVNGQTYYYMVSAVNAIGEGPRSNESSAIPVAVPTPPLNLTATAGDQQVSLAWEPPLSNGGSSITNYRIYRGTISGGEVFLIEVGNVTDYVDTGLSSGQTYYYLVSAVNAIGEGPKSNEASATPPIDPGPPLDLQAVLSGDDLENVTIAWALSSDDGGGQNSVIGYAIYRNTSYDTDGTGYALIAFLPSGTTEFIDATVGDGDTNSYFYQICAVDLNNKTTCAEEQAAKYAKHVAKGMILLSIPLDVSNNSITSVFQTVSYSRVLSYDAKAGKKHNWKVFDKKKPWSKPFDVNHTMALWVEVTTESYLTIAGVVPKSTTIHLHEGWNFVGYSSFIDRTVSDTLSTHYQTVETFNPTVSPWFLKSLGDNDLMMAGEGYWIHVSQDYDWVLTN